MSLLQFGPAKPPSRGGAYFKAPSEKDEVRDYLLIEARGDLKRLLIPALP